ncbi:MAG: hypothetical protein WAU17_08745, partial [Nitrospirales bacterium]
DRDKGYGRSPVQQAAAHRGRHLPAIQRNTIKPKAKIVIAGIPICGRPMRAYVRLACSACALGAAPRLNLRPSLRANHFL